MTATPLIPVVVILGPTGVGKSRLSLCLAEALNGEIVSADSALFYRGMDIGTAKPTPQERARVPHHLIDVAEPDEPWSLAVFRSRALHALRQIHRRQRLPILVGGSGQYLAALLEGWIPPQRPADPSLRRDLEAVAREFGPEELHRQLQQVDPERATHIDPRNVRRVVRALEIFRATGVPPSQLRKPQPPPLRSLLIGLTLPRSELYARLDRRIDAMLQKGLVDEVRRLLERGLSPGSQALSAIGYRQLVRHLQGELTLEQAVQQIRRCTRQLVRRQANWFKADDPRIHWFVARDGVEAAVISLVQAWLEMP